MAIPKNPSKPQDPAGPTSPPPAAEDALPQEEMPVDAFWDELSPSPDPLSPPDASAPIAPHSAPEPEVYERLHGIPYTVRGTGSVWHWQIGEMVSEDAYATRDEAELAAEAYIRGH